MEKILKFTSTFKNILVFSPHLDDALLSIGGLLAILEADKLVLNVFTEGSQLSSPLTSRLLSQAKMVDAKYYFELRKKEDKEAFKKLGGKVKRFNLEFTDAAWRVGKDQTPIYPLKILGEVDFKDNDLIIQIEAKIKNMFRDNPGVLVFAPLALGSHVDHQIVRNIVSRLYKKVIYYADFPYFQMYEKENDFVTKNHLQEINWPVDQAKKQELISHYKTQLAGVFKGQEIDLSWEKFYTNLS